MQFGPVPVTASVGRILAHNLTSPDGRRAFRKGHTVRAEDVAALRDVAGDTVYVATLEPGDVHEDEAARRLARAVVGAGVTLGPTAGGRVNVLAAERGVLTLDLARLDAVNALDGLTIATLRQHSVAQPKTIVATVKVIPYAVPDARLRQAEAVGPGVVGIRSLPARRVGVILTSSGAGRAKTMAALEPPIRARVEALGLSRQGESPFAEALFEKRRIEAGQVANFPDAAQMQRLLGALAHAGHLAHVERRQKAGLGSRHHP